MFVHRSHSFLFYFNIYQGPLYILFTHTHTHTYIRTIAYKHSPICIRIHISFLCFAKTNKRTMSMSPKLKDKINSGHLSWLYRWLCLRIRSRYIEMCVCVFVCLRVLMLNMMNARPACRMSEACLSCTTCEFRCIIMVGSLVGWG